MDPIKAIDPDRAKGAVEPDEPFQRSNNSMNGQLGHRDQDPRLKAFDTDFPEPGESPEHSGGTRIVSTLNDVA